MNITFYETFHDTRLNLKYLHSFNQRYYVYILKKTRALMIKFKFKTINVIFIEYTAFNKIYYIYNLNKRLIKEVRNIIFTSQTLLTSYTFKKIQNKRNYQFSAQTPFLTQTFTSQHLLISELISNNSNKDQNSQDYQSSLNHNSYNKDTIILTSINKNIIILASTKSNLSHKFARKKSISFKIKKISKNRAQLIQITLIFFTIKT